MPSKASKFLLRGLCGAVVFLSEIKDSRFFFQSFVLLTLEVSARFAVLCKRPDFPNASQFRQKKRKKTQKSLRQKRPLSPKNRDINGLFVNFRSIFLLQHRTQVCTGDELGVAGQPAGLDVGLGSHILGLALGKHLVGDFQRDLGVGDIDIDDIPLFDQADGAAGSCLGADVKRPSVMRATVLSSFIPARAEVGFSISRIPGPPLGPS